MIDQLFGSKVKAKLLRLFLHNPNEPYYINEVAKFIGSTTTTVKKELGLLENSGIIKSVKPTKEEFATEPLLTKEPVRRGEKKYFITDREFILYPELKALLVKAELLLEKNFIDKIKRIASPKLFILTGIFVGRDTLPTDMLIVGTTNKKKIASAIKAFEKDLNRTVNYTIMNPAEFKYRHDITDRFLYDILEGQKIIIIDSYSDPDVGYRLF